MWLRKASATLSDYLTRLAKWGKVYAPRNLGEQFHPLFVESLTKRDYIEYLSEVLKQLFALNMIKAHWVLTDEVRYRPQKRIGKTRRRYITFYKKQFTKFIARECLGESQRIC